MSSQKDDFVRRGNSNRNEKNTMDSWETSSTVTNDESLPELNRDISRGLEQNVNRNKLFIGSIPQHLRNAQVRELLEAIGPLQYLFLGPQRGASGKKGCYAFCEYQDPTKNEIACEVLNGLSIGGMVLRVHHHFVPSGDLNQEFLHRQQQQSEPYEDFEAVRSTQASSTRINSIHRRDKENQIDRSILDTDNGETLSSPPQPSSQSPSVAITKRDDAFTETNPSGEQVTRVVCLRKLLDNCNLLDDEEIDDILEEIYDECEKFGNLISVVLPKPKADSDYTPGVGKVFLEYSDKPDAKSARDRLDSRLFNGSTITASYFSEEKFFRGDYD